MIRKTIRNERGFATLIALIMVAMLTLIGLAALSTSDDETQIAGNELQETRAFYAAEAGLARAAAELHHLLDSTGTIPSTMPAGSDTMNGCAYSYTTVDNGPTQLRALSNGTLAGLQARVKTFTMTSTGTNNLDHGSVQLNQDFEAALVPLFQFAVFYQEDLEIAPGPDMSVIGRIHSNGDMYLQANNMLQMASYVTAAGDIYHGRKGPEPVGIGDVQIKDGSGNWVSMKQGSGWLESTDTYWYDSSVARWDGRVQDKTHGQTSLNVPINGTADPHKLIEDGGGNPDSYEYQATLKFKDGQAYQKVAGVWVNVTATMQSLGVISFANDQFYDQRESEWVDVMELDVQAMYDNGYAPENGIIYFSDDITSSSEWPALRMTNCDELDDGLTVASENPIYTVGDFNSVDKKPAAIMGDAITFLSDNWNDAKSTWSKSSRVATETTINACLVTGNVETTASNYSGGFENLPRFLEKWSGIDMHWLGSMICLWESQQATGLWGGSYYDPPVRNWSYDTDLDDVANMPPGTPNVRVIQHTGWKQEFIGYDV